MKKYTFYIDDEGDPDEGLSPMSDVVTVSVGSHHEYDEEFENLIKDVLKDWFFPADVWTEEE
jgi:hypothetical protein